MSENRIDLPGRFKVDAELVGVNGEDGVNKSGVAVYVVDTRSGYGRREGFERRGDEAWHEISRVAHVRRNGSQTRTPFTRQLRRELGKAKATAEALNALEQSVDAARAALANSTPDGDQQIGQVVQRAEQDRDEALKRLAEEQPETV